MYELKIYREVFVMKTKNDAKLEEELTCRFKIDMRNLKNSEKLIFELKNYRGVTFDGTQD